MRFQLSLRLMKVLGNQVFWSFTLVTFLMASLLAFVNLASRYALKDYVDSQLERTPWDFTVFRVGGSDRDMSVIDKVRSVEGVSAVESLAILRAKLPPEISELRIDGKPMQTPWLTLVAASDPSLLPPQLQMVSQSGNQQREIQPILALVGPENAMGEAFRALQGAKDFSVEVKSGNMQRSVFRTPLQGVVRLDRDELSRWLMDQMGAPAYIPPIGAVLLMPIDESRGVNSLREFDLLARGVLPLDMYAPTDNAMTGMMDHDQKGEYIPEYIYLARLDRDELITGWDVEKSLTNIVNVSSDVLQALARPAQVQNSLKKPQLNAVVTNDIIVGPNFWLPHLQQNGPPAVKNLYKGKLITDSDMVGQGEFIPVHGANEPPEHHDAELARGSAGFVVDSTTKVLLEQMREMARLIGIVTLLIAIPLLWMSWMFASNLSSLLMLNERRKLGLMRLRGVPGHLMGRTLLTSIASGGILGGITGIIFGSVILLLIYEKGSLPIEVLTQPQQLILSVLFLLITVILTLLVSSKLVKYATTISPLEASGRFASSEKNITSVKFGVVQFLCLITGVLFLSGWVFGYTILDYVSSDRIKAILVIFDFLALPLFLYGVITLLASRHAWIDTLLKPFQRLIGGRLALLTMRHMAAKPHRTVAFLMVVALMASVSLYPTVTSKTFENKAIRGAQVQLGSDWHFTFNSPDLAQANNLRGSVGNQISELKLSMEGITEKVRQVNGVKHAMYMVEAVLPSFYVPGAGTRGVPIYLINNSSIHAQAAYVEDELGVNDKFSEIMGRVTEGGVALSPAVAEFWERETGEALRLGVDDENNTVSAPVAGVFGHLPGMPPRSVTNREGYVQSRVDYINYLFDQAAYLVADTESSHIQDLQVFIPRTVLMVKVDENLLSSDSEMARLRSELASVFPVTPLEIHTLPEEIRKVGSDMFVILTMENMKIYLVGGMLLALIAIIAIALANYTEDRRTLALLRIRGTSPQQLRRFIMTILVSPAIIGLIIGTITSLIAGYGLTNRVWELREIKSVVQMLNTHLVISELTVGLAVFILAIVISSSWLIAKWVFRSETRQVH